MSILAQDIRFAARMLMKHPAVSLVAVITLALGIGANTAVFSWIDAFLLRPIPGAERTDRIVVVQQTSAEGSHSNLSYPEYLDFRDRAVSLAGLIAYDMQAMNLGGDGKPERIWGTLVTGNYFDVLGVRAALGRTFLPDEDLTPGARPVVVISHGLWQRRFAGDPGIVGRSITLNNSAFTVVGVAQPDFQGNFTGLAMEAWVPTMMQEVIVPGGDRLSVSGSRWLESMARLAPGATREQAQAELSTIAAAMARESGAAGSGDSMVTLTPLWRAGPAEILGPVLMLTLGVVGLLLLIACANVASLALARAASRRREVAVRLALGAGRARLIRQMLTESLLLSALGGLAGWVLALWCAGLLMNLAPPVDFPLALAIRLDWRIFAFNLAVSMAAGVIFGLFPALQASRPDLVTALKNESAAVTGEARRNRFRNGLVVAQVAMSLLLLVFAGLLLRSLQSARSLDPGFNSDGVLLASLDLFPNGYDAASGRQLQSRLLERVERLPGVESAALARKIPLGMGGTSSMSITVEGYTPTSRQQPWAFQNHISPGFFETLGVPIVAGRVFGDGDTAGAPLVAIVNQSMARRYWEKEDPVGRRIRLGQEWVTVVGVVQDYKYKSLGEGAVPYMFHPLGQFYRPDVTLFVRASGDPRDLAVAVQREVLSLDANLPVFGVSTLSRTTLAAVIPQRMGGWLLASFGLLGLAMAAVGLYGLLSFLVSQRTRELGVRMAMGAEPSDILRLVISQGMKLAGIGAVIGLALAAALAPLLRGMLFGVGALDPVSYIAVTLLLLGVALLAGYLPARRAVNVDPMIALRYE